MTIQDVLTAASQLSQEEQLQVAIHLLESLEQIPTENTEAIHVLTQTLTRRSLRITKTSDVMGGDACIANTRLPVWLFVSLRRQGATDTELLEAYPRLSETDLADAWIYAEAHAEEIENALKEQVAALEEVV
ncbi:MAG: DUF433 domain-containing protein [Prochlorotrichaceae cyanobacterium]